MSYRAVLHLPKWLIRFAGFAVLLGVIVFVGLTRTQLGRDNLRNRVLGTFNTTFNGQLVIGNLTGNLINTLYATDVALLDSLGNPIVTVDSVVIAQRWETLFIRRISIRRIHLIRPTFYLSQDTSGAWNLAQALARNQPRAERLNRRWSIASAALTIDDGTVLTHTARPPPTLVEQGWLFDLETTRTEDLTAEITLDWGLEDRQLDVVRLAANVVTPALDAIQVQGQLVIEDTAVLLNQLLVTSGASEVRLNGSLRAAALADAPPTVDVNLETGAMAPAQLRALIPRYPLTAPIRLAGTMRGPLNDLRVDPWTMASGRSQARGRITLRQTDDSLRITSRLDTLRLLRPDLNALLRDQPLVDAYQTDTLATKGTATLVFPRGEGLQMARATLAFESRADAARAAGTARLQAQRGGYALASDVRFSNVDASRFQQSWPSTRFSGQMWLSGVGPSLARATGQARLTLDAPRYLGHTTDSLSVRLTALAGRWSTETRIREGAGLAQATASLDLTETAPILAFDAQLTQFDLGPVLALDSVRTAFNTTVALRSTGRLGPDFAGTVSIRYDSSEVARGATVRPVVPHAIAIDLAPLAADRPRVRLTGDAGTLTLDGDVSYRALSQLGQLWATAFIESMRRETNKTYAEAPADVLPERTERLRQAARIQLGRTGFPHRLNVTASFGLTRSELLSALFLSAPPMAGVFDGTVNLVISPDDLLLDGTVRADSFTVGATRLDTLYSSFVVAGSLEAPLERTLSVDVQVEGEQFAFPVLPLFNPRLSLQYANQHADVSLDAQQGSLRGPLRLKAALDLLPTRNRLTLHEVFLQGDASVWRNTTRVPITLYRDAIVLPPLTVVNERADSLGSERIRLAGTFSSLPQDTLRVDAESITLHPFFDLLSFRYPVGGLLDGNIALTGGSRQPTVAGNVQVTGASLDNRLLGDLSVESRLTPGQPDVGVRLRLSPVADSLENAPPLFGTDAPPVVEPSELLIDGLVRFPQTDERGQMVDPGRLAFNADLERIDLFFLDYLFPGKVVDTQGAVSGSGTITGTLTRPLFDLALRSTSIATELPSFGLSYAATGDIRVDSLGLHFDDLRVSDGTGGTAAVDGSMLFNAYQFISYDIDGILDRFQVMNVARSDTLPFYGTIWASGDATLDGPLSSSVLRSTNVVTAPESRLYIPIIESAEDADESFIIFADSTGIIPDLRSYTRRRNILARRPTGERSFMDGLDIDLNLFAPSGSTIYLVFDPLLGDVIQAEGSGRIQFQRTGDEYTTFGTFTVSSGTYLFTAGDLFVRRFQLEQGGTLTWDGDPLNAQLNLPASYRTRASTAGLPNTAANTTNALIPLIVELRISGRVEAPEVDLSLVIDRNELNVLGSYQGLEAQLNQPDRATEYATSVLLTNSFRLTTDNLNPSNSGGQLAFTSLSQLVSSQLNRFLSEALPNVDFTFGVQGDNAQDLDVTYGVALRLLDERLIIRGEGVYQGSRAASSEVATENLQGEFVVEVRLSPNLSVEVFYRRESDVLAESAALTNTTGAGVSYQTEFTSWRILWRRLFGWLRPDDPGPNAPPEVPVAEGN